MKIINKKSISKMIASMLVMCSILGIMTGCNSNNSDNDKTVIQEATDKLVLYGGPFDHSMLKAGLEIFEEQYPDVEVEYKDFGTFFEPDALQNYMDTLTTDLASGSGPDLIFSQSFEFKDIHNIMDSGIFLDMNTLLENDKTLDKSLYNETVFNSGIYKNQCLYIPVSYNLLTLTTTEEALDSAGIEFNNQTEYNNMLTSFTDFMAANKGSSDMTLLSSAVSLERAFTPWNGVEPIDYENDKILTNTDEFKASMDFYKAFYSIDANLEIPDATSTCEGSMAVRNNKSLFIYNNDGVLSSFENFSSLLHDQTPIIRTFPSYDNKVVANSEYIAGIRSGSSNQANAYNFLKILLSEKFQKENGMYRYTNGVSMSIPVYKDAVREGILHWAEENGGVTAIDGSFTYGMLSEEDIQLLVDTYSNVDSCPPTNMKTEDFIWEEMEPYFNDEKAYDECIENLNNKLELYINE